MPALLRSPRRRRRLAWLAGPGIPLVALVTWFALLGNTGNPVESRATGPDEPAAAAPEPALELTPALRREAGRLVERFVATAVVRADPAAAWELAAPELRAGHSRGSWAAGDLPVQPFPARALAATDWRVAYVDGQTLALDVTLHAKPRSGVRPQVYAVELAAGERGLRVRSWAPLAQLVSGDSPRAAPTQEAAPAPARKARLGMAWLLVPGSLLALLVLAPLTLVVRSVVRDRRAQRAYRAGR